MTGLVIENHQQVKKLLKEVAPRLAQNILRSTIHATVGDIVKDAKKRAPKRKGMLRRAIKSKRNKVRKGVISSSVIVTKGKSAKASGWYWRFIEKGTDKLAADPFFQPAFDTINSQLPQIMRSNFGKKYEAALKREAKKAKR